MKHQKYIVSILMLLLLESGFSAAFAVKKIVVLSDIHVMDESLLDSPDNAAWLEDLALDKKMQDLSIPVFDTLVKQVILEQPDALLITGDLTKDGEVVSHDYVVKKLTEIEEAGIPVYVIPGNHDRGWQEGAKKYENNTSTATKYMSVSRFLSYYEPFGYGEGSEVHEESLSYVSELFPGLTLIGLDSGQTASLETSTLNWLGQKLLEAKEKGSQVLVMVHHSVIPHFFGQESFQANSVIQDEEYNEEEELSKLGQTLLQGGVKVVLTGHYHVSDIARYQKEDQALYDVCTGSPLSYPCDYRILTFDDQFKTLNIVTKSLDKLEGYDDFPVYAKDRLRTSVSSWASRWMDEKIPDQEAVKLLLPAITNVFVIHAEGNEPENPGTQEAILLFESIDLLSPIFSDVTQATINLVTQSIKSILGDYPSEREPDNVVNDRELTLTMPELPTAIKTVRKADSDEDVWYTLQGVRLPSAPTKTGLYIRNNEKCHIRD